LDTQTISVAAGVISVAVAALGLLLTWYRHEEKEGRKSSNGTTSHPLSKRTRTRMFLALAVGVTAIALGGIVFTFEVGTNAQGPSGHSSVAEKSSSASSPLTAAQYRGRLGQICSDTFRKAQEIAQSRPMRTAIGPEIIIQQDALAATRPLVPPKVLAARNMEMIAVWKREISLLVSIYSRLPYLSDSELESGVKEASQLTTELDKIFRLLGVQECVI
jgi:hypothetical protein